eukprot:809803-Pleurochrysis_carterae.AAC.1
MAKPPRRGRFSSGATCEMFTSRPRSERALRQCTRASSLASRRMAAMSASKSVRLLPGQRSRPV